LRAVLGRVQVHAERVGVELCRRSVKNLLSSDQAPEESLAALATSSGAAEIADASCSDTGPIRLEITTQMRRRGNELKFLVAGENVEESRAADENLVRLIVRARILARRIRENPAATLKDVAAQEGFGSNYAGRLLRLTSLAPDIVTAILGGRQPPELTANMLMADTRWPLDWTAQRAMLGFPPRAVTG
jgi:site-specific DNA recombinase